MSLLTGAGEAPAAKLHRPAAPGLFDAGAELHFQHLRPIGEIQSINDLVAIPHAQHDPLAILETPFFYAVQNHAAIFQILADAYADEA